MPIKAYESLEYMLTAHFQVAARIFQ